MTPGLHGDRVASIAASSCSIEIWIHTFLLSVVLLPLVLIVFPFLTVHVGASLINSNVSQDWLHWEHRAPQPDYTLLSDGQELFLSSAVTFCILTSTAIKYVISRKQGEAVTKERRYQSLRGAKGTALLGRVETLWSRVALQSTPAPEVLWFASSAAAARAMNLAGRSAIALSIGLWEAIDNGDPIAEIVLLHELAHLAYNDPQSFARLTSLLETVSRALKVMFLALISIVGFLMLQVLIANIWNKLSAGTIVAQEVMIALIGLFATSLGPVAVATVRRYIGFITSLVELRADVRSAEWAGGTEHFAEILRNTPMVHRSTLRDRASSLFSLELTHLSESERVELLSDPERLLTPKLRYFVFTLVLALLFPLNGLTPLFEGGIFDLAVVVTVAMALTIGVCTMLVVAGSAIPRMSPVRLFELSAAVVLFVAASQLNLYTLTYSLSTIAVGIGLPSSGADFSAQSAFADLRSALHDVGGQISGAWAHGWLLSSILLTTSLLAALFKGSSKLRPIGRPDRWRLGLIAAAAGLGVLIDGYDPWRAFVIEHTYLGDVLTSWATVVARLPGIRFTLGPAFALAVILALLGSSLLMRRIQPVFHATD